jgi:hypothetical protein
MLISFATHFPAHSKGVVFAEKLEEFILGQNSLCSGATPRRSLRLRASLGRIAWAVVIASANTVSNRFMKKERAPQTSTLRSVRHTCTASRWVCRR